METIQKILKDPNTGVPNGFIPERVPETEYMFGADNGIEKRIFETSGNYDKWLPVWEYQSSVYFDTWGCLSEATTAHIATNMMYQILKLDEISDEDMAWLKKEGYIGDDGKMNISARYIAKLSDTRIGYGNTGSKVAYAVYKYGVVPESRYFFDMKDRDPKNNSVEKYYQEVPKEMLDLGKEFLKRFKINYEVVWSKDIKEALMYGPVMQFVYGWQKNDKNIYINPDKKTNHAVLRKRVDNPRIRDTYLPNDKNLADDYYYYPSAYQYTIQVINKKKKNKMKLVKTTLGKTVYLIDATGMRRAFYDARHFEQVAPVLGLSKWTRDNEGKIDWSQVQIIKTKELEGYPLGRPLVVIN